MIERFRVEWHVLTQEAPYAAAPRGTVYRDPAQWATPDASTDVVHSGAVTMHERVVNRPEATVPGVFYGNAAVTPVFLVERSNGTFVEVPVAACRRVPVVEACGACRFWQSMTTPVTPRGLCRRRAPNPQFPEQFANSRCGEFELAPHVAEAP